MRLINLKISKKFWSIVLFVVTFFVFISGLTIRLIAANTSPVQQPIFDQPTILKRYVWSLNLKDPKLIGVPVLRQLPQPPSETALITALHFLVELNFFGHYQIERRIANFTSQDFWKMFSSAQSQSRRIANFTSQDFWDLIRNPRINLQYFFWFFGAHQNPIYHWIGLNERLWAATTSLHEQIAKRPLVPEFQWRFAQNWADLKKLQDEITYFFRPSLPAKAIEKPSKTTEPQQLTVTEFEMMKIRFRWTLRWLYQELTTLLYRSDQLWDLITLYSQNVTQILNDVQDQSWPFVIDKIIAKTQFPLQNAYKWFLISDHADQQILEQLNTVVKFQSTR